jgi:glucans biosynthesis protein
VRQRLLSVPLLLAMMLFSDTTGKAPQEVVSESQVPLNAAVNLDLIERLARERADRPYVHGSDNLPERLASLGYDQYRDIRFRPAQALWRGQGLFEVQLFHRGFIYRDRVAIWEATPQGSRPVRYSSSLFTFGKSGAPANLPANLGFAGLRIHYPLHRPAYKDEIIVFLGASYFRVLGRNQGYGISARGLAVNTGLNRGEEFPRFTDFWLVRPAPSDRVLTIYALLDSESVTGAYRFVIRPSGTTRVEVTKTLFLRKRVAKLGIAPLTSMFLYGENPSGRRFDDFRPEVHDSDGLMARTGNDEWLWRPLLNPDRLRVSRLLDQDPKGFGLVQRDRDFTHYQDNEARYHARPSYWVEPHGTWGRGAVELVEIPSNEEIHDNIVAFWVAEKRAEIRQPLRYSYALSAFAQSHEWPPGGRAIATRVGNAAVGGYRNFGLDPRTRRFVVDFAGGDLNGLAATQPVVAQVSGSGATIDEVTVERVPETGAWRVAFRVLPRANESVDLRCFLTLYGESLTETWTYLSVP